MAVMFTDIAGYSKLTQEDESLALNFVRRFQMAVQVHTRAFHGEVVHFYGDGSLTLHASVLDAIQCAKAIQETLRHDPVVPVRIGIHLGEVVRQGDSTYGNAVNIASRLHQLGPPRSILTSGTVANQLINHPDVELAYVGVESVKHIKKPIRVYALKGDGLVVPTWTAIHRRNPQRMRKSLLLPALLLAGIVLVAAIQIWSGYGRFNIPPSEERLVVLPFSNNTGDSTLAFIGHIASRHISRCLEESDNARVVSYDHLVRNEQLQHFNFFDLRAVIRGFGARNFIEGSYVIVQDTLLQFVSALRDGKTMEHIQHFPVVTTKLRKYTSGIEELGQRISGYWMSKEANPLSIPRQDAYKAFVEGQYHWQSDYARAADYLQRSIALDSNFLDAYYFLFDAYANQWLYHEASDVLDLINRRFSVEQFNGRQLLNHRFYEAQIACDNERAYKILHEMYEADPDEYFLNTQMAIAALHFVNEPRQCLAILERIPFDSLDLEINRHALGRVSLAVQASFALGQYEEAARYACYFPRDDWTTNHLELQARALAGVRDTAGIEVLLSRIEMAGKSRAHRIVLYGLSRDFRLLEEPDLAHYYRNRALAAYASHQSAIYGELLLDAGSVDQGMAHFTTLREAYGDHPLVLAGLARAHALREDFEQARSLIPLLAKQKPERFDFGQSEYDQARIYALLNAPDQALHKL
ncbi:MAG: adenylate/guanylate cyclase domain-containing protein, partial [Saprospiraceae bacterium]|nr:adenylate/guanylate cyclase domain-containing protein [Saprospiraceae bacterium]